MSDYALDYFEIPSADTAGSRAFFSQAFGWSMVDYGGTYTEVRDAGLVWGINADAGDRSAAPVGVIRTADIAKAEQAVVAAGGIITRPAYDYPGGKRLFFREPGGAEFAVYEPRE
mgnify:CR=1 FL=1